MILARIALSVCFAALVWADSPSALFKKARKAERAGDFVNAYLLYSEAAALDPANKTYWAHSYALRTKAGMAAKVMPPPVAAPSPVETAALSPLPEPAPPLAAALPPPEAAPGEEPPSGVETVITDEDLRDVKRLRPPPELKPSNEIKSFDLRGDAKRLFEQVARAYGLDVVFDGDYSAGQPIRFRVTEMGFREAIHSLEAVTGSFIAAVNERMFLVAKDTQQKRNEVEPTVAITFPIPQTTTPQETQELARAVQQVMELQKFAIDSTRRLVLVRDRISKLRPALEVFADMLVDKPQVAIEMEFLEVTKNSSLEYGLSLPTSFPLVSFGKALNSAISVPAGFTKFLAFGGGATFLGLGLTDAQLFASMSRSTSTNLLQTTLRSLDGQAATFHIGDRFPILTAGYFGDTGTATGQVFRPPPSFTFEDLGLMMKVTPRVHGMDEVSLDVEAEFKVLGGSAVNGIPVISSRKFKSIIRLKSGEWAVMAGLLTTSEARNLSGIAGLANLPYIGALFRSNTKTESEGQTLIILKPHVLNFPSSETVTREWWTGSETRPVTPL